MTLQSFNKKILQYYLVEILKLTNRLITMQKLHLHQLKYALPSVEINNVILCICYQNEQYRKLYRMLINLFHQEHMEEYRQ